MAQPKTNWFAVILFFGVQNIFFTILFGGDTLDTPIFLLPLAAIPAGAVAIPYYLAFAGPSQTVMPQQRWSGEAATMSILGGWVFLLCGTWGMNKAYGGDGGPRDTLMGYYLPKVLVVVAAFYVGFVASLEAVDWWARIERSWGSSAPPEDLEGLDEGVTRLKRLRGVISPAPWFYGEEGGVETV